MKTHFPFLGLWVILSSFCEGYVTSLCLMSFLCAILVSLVLQFCPESQKSFQVRFRLGSFTSSRVLLIVNCFSNMRGIEYDLDFHGDILPRKALFLYDRRHSYAG